MTGGCRRCNNKEKYYSVIVPYPRVGAYEVDCHFGGNKTAQENDFCGNGQILQWEGVIESQRKLVCTTCTTLIPNCLACDSSKNCNLCNAGF